MRTISIILMGLSLLFTSCEDKGHEETSPDENKNTEEQSAKELTMEEALSKRWMYKERTSTDGEKKFSYGDESSDVILRLDHNGYFMIYDSITDQRIIEKGVRRIEQRSSGQWELLSEDLLVLRKISNDTVVVDSLQIESIRNDKLVTSTINKNKITYFSIE